jgi:MobA/MobL family
MAIYHLSASIIKRSAGRSVTAAAAYRTAAKIEDLKTGIVHDYSRKQGVDYSEIISPVSTNSNSNNDWLTNRAELWNKIELVEKRKDAQLAREVTIAIPTELSKLDQIALVREYVQTNYVAAGMIADINLHHLDGDNPHAHILLTMRNLQTSPAGVVEFGLKNTDWNSKDLLLAQRKSWEEVANKYLAARGLDTRIDCRSLEEQGSPYIPQIHVGVHAMAMKRKGIPTDRGEEFDRIEAANNDIRARLEEVYQNNTEPEEQDIKPIDKIGNSILNLIYDHGEEQIKEKDKSYWLLRYGQYMFQRYKDTQKDLVRVRYHHVEEEYKSSIEFNFQNGEWKSDYKYLQDYYQLGNTVEKVNNLAVRVKSLIEEETFTNEEIRDIKLFYLNTDSLDISRFSEDYFSTMIKNKWKISTIESMFNVKLTKAKAKAETEEKPEIIKQMAIVNIHKIIVAPEPETKLEEQIKLEELEIKAQKNINNQLDRKLANNIIYCINAYTQDKIITKYHQLSWDEASQSIEVKLKTEISKPPILTLKYTSDSWTTNEKDLELKREILKKVLEVNQEINDRQSQKSNEPKHHSRGR